MTQPNHIVALGEPEPAEDRKAARREWDALAIEAQKEVTADEHGEQALSRDRG